MTTLHTEVKELNIGYGIKSKTNKWFCYFYKTEKQAIKVAHNIEAHWTVHDDQCNFQHKNPFLYVDK